MSMFSNYQNPNQSRPDNRYKAFPAETYTSKLNPIEASQPYELYNTKGDLEGYYWNYGDSIKLEFNIDGEITIESDALVFRKNGQDPSKLNTPATIGQRAYNIIDLRSWTCVGIYKHEYMWEEDEIFTFPSFETRQLYVNAEDYMKDKVVTIKLYNFRLEEIYSETLAGSIQPTLAITSDFSKGLKKGIYYCSLEVSGNDMHQTIFAPQDCKLLVK